MQPRGADVLDRRLEQPLEALLDELRDLVVHQLARDREVPFGGQPVEADRGAPEAVRVAGAGRAVASPNETLSESILSAAERTRPVSVLRQRRVRGVGQVLLVDRGADRLRVAGEPRVLRADVALELRELAHQLGRLVGLCKPRSLERGLSATERLDELREPRPSCPRTSRRRGRT